MIRLVSMLTIHIQIHTVAFTHAFALQFFCSCSLLVAFNFRCHALMIFPHRLR